MPAPSIDADIRPFWDALNEGRFALHHCQQCDAWYFPATICKNHESGPFFAGMADEASGHGRIFAFNVHYSAFTVAMQDKVPYIYALIELDEGPMIGSNIVGCSPEQLQINAPVCVKLQPDPDSGWTLPLFELVEG